MAAIIKVQMQTKNRVEDINKRSSMIEQVDQDEVGDGDCPCHMRASFHFNNTFLNIFLLL